MEVDDKRGIVVITGNSHPELAKLVVNRLGTRLGECTVLVKPNRETQVDIKQSVRHKDVFIIQTGGKDVNNTVMELLIMIYACKTSCAKSIHVVMPYMPYSKQCKMWRRGSVTGKLVADMICKAGATRFITMDLYRKEIQGFFSVPVDNLRASPFLLSYIQENIQDYKNAVIVAKNPGCLNKATSYAERLRVAIAVIHGESKNDDDEDGRNSPPDPDEQSTSTCEPRPKPETFQYSVGFPLLLAKEKPPLTVVGDVSGKIAIMVDDIADEVDSFVDAAQALHECGAYKIYVVATHGVLSRDAPSALEHSHVDEIVVSNTVPHDVQKMQCHKIRTVDVSLMFSEAIRRIYYNESMSYLFKDVTLDD